MSKCVHGWRGSSIAETPIVDACPSCGGRSLFIGAGGFLTCSYIPCKEPGIGRWMETARARIAELERERDEAIGNREYAESVLATATGAPSIARSLSWLADERDDEPDDAENAQHVIDLLIAINHERDAAMNEVGELGIVNEGLALKLAAAQRENAELREALIRLRDCDFVITPADRMDAVRDIARAAIDRAREKASE